MTDIVKLQQDIISIFTQTPKIGSEPDNMPTEALYKELEGSPYNHENHLINKAINELKSLGHIEQHGGFTYYYEDPTQPRKEDDGFNPQ